jgi:cyanophycin synthetase
MLCRIMLSELSAIRPAPVLAFAQGLTEYPIHCAPNQVIPSASEVTDTALSAANTNTAGTKNNYQVDMTVGFARAPDVGELALSSDLAAGLNALLALQCAALQAAMVPLFAIPTTMACELGSAGHHLVLSYGDNTTLTSASLLSSLSACAKIALTISRRAAEAPADLSSFYDQLASTVFTLPGMNNPAHGGSLIHVLRAAWEAGVPFYSRGHGVFQLGQGALSRLVERSATDADSAMGAKITQRKALTAMLLRDAGLPVPKHFAAETRDQAVAAARALGFPLVAKPVDRDRGEGVTVDLQNEAAVLAAFDMAYSVSSLKRVLIERQVDGVCHRILINAGKQLYAVKRWPLGFWGDAKNTVNELFERELAIHHAKPPWLRKPFVALDALARSTLQRQGLASNSVPLKGQFVALRPIESTADGGVSEDVTTVIHPDNIDIAVRAAEVLQLERAGIDLMTTDISRPWHETGGVILEANYAPSLGTGAVSRRYLPVLIEQMMPKQGRISVTWIEDDLQLARRCHQDLCSQGQAAWLVSQDQILTPQGAVCVLATDAMLASVKALLFQRDVVHLVLVAEGTMLSRIRSTLDL